MGTRWDTEDLVYVREERVGFLEDLRCSQRGDPRRDRAWKRGGGGYEEVCLGVGGGGVGIHQ